MSILVDAALPAGNILPQSVSGNTVFLRKDLRDTEGDWFYWKFRVRLETPGEYEFRFENGPAIGPLGPAFSLDQGQSWAYLGEQSIRRDPDGFRYAFTGKDPEVFFCMAIPYLQSNWEKFLAPRRKLPWIRESVHCLSRKGRKVERLEIADFKCGETSHVKKLFL